MAFILKSYCFRTFFSSELKAQNSRWGQFSILYARLRWSLFFPCQHVLRYVSQGRALKREVCIRAFRVSHYGLCLRKHKHAYNEPWWPVQASTTVTKQPLHGPLDSDQNAKALCTSNKHHFFVREHLTIRNCMWVDVTRLQPLIVSFKHLKSNVMNPN